MTTVYTFDSVGPKYCMFVGKTTAECMRQLRAENQKLMDSYSDKFADTNVEMWFWFVVTGFVEDKECKMICELQKKG
jgi:hypothetical protein